MTAKPRAPETDIKSVSVQFTQRNILKMHQIHQKINNSLGTIYFAMVHAQTGKIISALSWKVGTIYNTKMFKKMILKLIRRLIPLSYVNWPNE